MSRYEYPIERMADPWEGDPGLRRLPRLSVSPVPGGAALGLAGEF